MLRKREIYVASVAILTLFFSLTVYFMYTINYDDSSNNNVRLATTEYNIELIEYDIKLKALNLPEDYKRKHAKSELLLDNFFKNLKKNNSVQNLSKLWQEADKLITKDQLFDSNFDDLGNVIKALKTAKILLADNYSKGTQLKLLFKLEGNHLAVFKPQWYNKEKVILGNVYAGKDRYGSEILAFYLASILDLKLVPIAAERTVHIKRDISPVATSILNNTIIEKREKTCIYGKCFYCKREDPVCSDSDGYLRGAILYHVPGKLQAFRSPWQRTYKSNKKAIWETQPNYCLFVKGKLTNKRLLDLIDVSIFDFLIQNGDRHHYETLNNKVVLIDNGKGLGNPYVHHIDILAPLYQCCVLRQNTWDRLKLLSGGLLRDVLQAIPEVTNVVTPPHLQAIEQRLDLVYAAVEKCRTRNKIFYNTT